MKLLTIINSFILVFILSLHGKIYSSENEPSFKNLKKAQISEYQLTKQSHFRKILMQKLTEAKYFLINGNIKKAKKILMSLEGSNLTTKKISYRYLAIIYFIENEFEKVLEILGKKSLVSDKDYKRYCVLKIINMVILKKFRLLKGELEHCIAINFGSSPTDHLWLEGMTKLAQKDPSFLRKESLYGHFVEPHKIDLKLLRVLLKLVIYLNREKTIEDLLYSLPQEAYDSSEIRELIGFIFYRLGDNEKALTFLEDLSTSNAENIKGNIDLAKKAYELAFGHFQLALKKKQNSGNAIERSIPLAWKLNQWEKGIELVKKVREVKGNRKKKLSLLTAFLTKTGNHNEAHTNLLELQKLFKGQFPKEVNILKSYNSLMLGQKENLKKYTYSSCKQFDGLSCWLLFQTEIWENISKTIKRKDKTYDDNNLTIDSLKTKVELDPLDENIFIQQQDIEEMDHRQFELQF